VEVLLFGGTWEGRTLAQSLAAMGISVTYSVATDYGRDLTQPATNLAVLTGRLDEEAMEELMRGTPFSCVVDATHPYAAEVSRNIKAASARVGLRYHRLLRASLEAEDVLLADSPEEAVKLLSGTEGPILLTTGSKELAAFTALPDYRKRLWVRILPSQESLAIALSQGIPSKQIICMQGPFTQDLNAAMMRQIGCTYLVTKDSGKAGGFTEKVEAARQVGAKLLVISRPTQEEGVTMEELLAEFQKEVAP
jgi:precorrin-6x reductase